MQENGQERDAIDGVSKGKHIYVRVLVCLGNRQVDYDEPWLFRSNFLYFLRQTGGWEY